MQQKVGKEIQGHYESFKKGGQPDKQMRPLFVVPSGTGTGKSRLSDEFIQNVAVPGLKMLMNETLAQTLENAVVVKVAFENGTRTLTNHWTGDHEIGARIAHALLEEEQDWSVFLHNITSTPIPVGVALDHCIGTLSEVVSANVFLMMVFVCVGLLEKGKVAVLVVDGMQTLLQDQETRDPENSAISKPASVTSSAMEEKQGIIVCGLLWTHRVWGVSHLMPRNRESIPFGKIQGSHQCPVGPCGQ